MNPAEPLTWLAASLALAAVATNLGWLIASRLAQRGRSAAVLAWRGLPALSWLAVALFLLLPPAGAWRSGALSPYFMGLAEVDWSLTLGTGLPLAVLVGGLILLGRLTGRHPRLVGPRWLAALDAALYQWHWAFYRAAAIGALSGLALDEAPALLRPLLADAPYSGIWLGLLLAGVEWALNPFARAALRTADRAAGTLQTMALAVATAAIFSLTRNLALCLALHVVVAAVTVHGQKTNQVS